MDDFEKKLTITDSMESDTQTDLTSKTILLLLRRFLHIQQRRAQAYASLKRGFDEYMVSGGELAYQQLCSEITQEFNDCSKQVLEMESQFSNPNYGRVDLSQLLRAVQTQEKQKLHLLTVDSSALISTHFELQVFYSIGFMKKYEGGRRKYAPKDEFSSSRCISYNVCRPFSVLEMVRATLRSSMVKWW